MALRWSSQQKRLSFSAAYATHLGFLQPLFIPSCMSVVRPVHAGHICDTQLEPLMSIRVMSLSLLSFTVTTWPHFASQKTSFFFFRIFRVTLNPSISNILPWHRSATLSHTRLLYKDAGLFLEGKQPLPCLPRVWPSCVASTRIYRLHAAPAGANVRRDPLSLE